MDDIKNELPSGIKSVWEYTYELEWIDGSPESYFQVEVGNADIFHARGDHGLDGWLTKKPIGGERYFNFFANEFYLGDNVVSGRLQLWTNAPPENGWLVYSGDSFIGPTPNIIPEPASIVLLGIGLAGLAGVIIRRRIKRLSK